MEIKGNLLANNNTFVILDTDLDLYKVYSIENINEYRTNTGTLLYSESPVSELQYNVWDTDFNFSDTEINQYFSGDNPLEQISFYRNEAVDLSLDFHKNDLDIIEKWPKSSIIYKKYFNSGNDVDDKSEGTSEVTTGVTTPNSEYTGAKGGGPGPVGGGYANYSVLKYPIDMDLKVQDHLAITAARYEPAKNLPKVDKDYDRPQWSRTNNSKLLETIIIPMPNQIADQNSVNWGANSFSSVAGELFNPTSERLLAGDKFNDKEKTASLQDLTNQNFLKSSLGYVGELGKAFGNTAGSTFIRRRLLLGAAAGAASVVGLNVDVGAVITRTTGFIENTNLELLFTGPGLRIFNFQVRFSPRNTDESKIVRSIVRTLKERMAVRKAPPQVGNFKGGSNMLLGSPCVWRIQYRRGSTRNEEIKGLNKFKTCAMTNLNVDYTGGTGRWQSYGDDSQPISTIVTMSFSELTPLYDRDYRDGGFEPDDVGF